MWKLPPLILHPFADSGGPGKLVESSRATLMLQGLLPAGPHSHAELEQKVIEGRYCEIRMLFYVGKDLERWIGQCLEFATSEDELRRAELKYQSFSDFLVRCPPARVQAKLKQWGVADYPSIFARALGMNALFTEMPDRLALSDQFIRNYYRYADSLFECRQSLACFPRIGSANFDFDLYASGEYSRMLEREWAED